MARSTRRSLASNPQEEAAAWSAAGCATLEYNGSAAAADGSGFPRVAFFLFRLYDGVLDRFVGRGGDMHRQQRRARQRGDRGVGVEQHLEHLEKRIQETASIQTEKITLMESMRAKLSKVEEDQTEQEERRRVELREAALGNASEGEKPKA